MSKIETLHNSSHRLCGAHFKPDMIVQNHKRKLLREKAVPTIFVTLPRSVTAEGIIKLFITSYIHIIIIIIIEGCYIATTAV